MPAGLHVQPTHQRVQTSYAKNTHDVDKTTKNRFKHRFVPEFDKYKELFLKHSINQVEMLKGSKKVFENVNLNGITEIEQLWTRMTKTMKHRNRLKDYFHSDKILTIFIDMDKEKISNGTILYGRQSLNGLKGSLSRISLKVATEFAMRNAENMEREPIYKWVQDANGLYQYSSHMLAWKVKNARNNGTQNSIENSRKTEQRMSLWIFREVLLVNAGQMYFVPATLLNTTYFLIMGVRSGRGGDAKRVTLFDLFNVKKTPGGDEYIELRRPSGVKNDKDTGSSNNRDAGDRSVPVYLWNQPAKNLGWINPFKVVQMYCQALPPEIKNATDEEKKKKGAWYQAKRTYDSNVCCQCLFVMLIRCFFFSLFGIDNLRLVNY